MESGWPGGASPHFASIAVTEIGAPTRRYEEPATSGPLEAASFRRLGLEAVGLDSSIDARWQAEFEARAGQHARLRAVAVPRFDARVVRDLRKSLAVFQLGESGDGTHLLEAANLSMAGDQYLSALKHFVAEEQEHARILAVVLEALDGPLLSQHWSDRIFVLARRARSLVTEVLVLLVAEVVALTYYSTLRDGLASGELREVFAQIHDDEVVHVDFHCDTLPQHLNRFSGPTRSIVRVGWSTLVTGAAIGVAISHGAALRSMGTSRHDFVRRVLHDRDEVARRLFGPDRYAT
jgi:hypothetical protein